MSQSSRSSSSTPPLEEPYSKLSPQKSIRSLDLSTTAGSSTSTPSLHSLPYSKIKAIMNSTPDSLKPSDEGLFAMTKATESFIMMLAEGAYKHNKNTHTLGYNGLAEFVQGNDDLVHIHEMVPRKVKFSSIEDQIQRAANKR